MKSAALLVLLLAAPNADRPFVSGGRVNIQLEGGEYEIRASADNHIRVTMSGNVGKAVAEVTTKEKQADVKVKNTPNFGNFHAVIEIPKISDIIVRLSGGDLTVGSFTGNKDIEATAGDVKIDAGSAADYGSVDAAVKVGDLSGGPFGKATGEFISKSLNWSGKGKYKLHATLGAGDLKLR
jgi:hypothetical protein